MTKRQHPFPDLQKGVVQYARATFVPNPASPTNPVMNVENVVTRPHNVGGFRDTIKLCMKVKNTTAMNVTI